MWVPYSAKIQVEVWKPCGNTVSTTSNYYYEYNWRTQLPTPGCRIFQLPERLMKIRRKFQVEVWKPCGNTVSATSIIDDTPQTSRRIYLQTVSSL
jgi:hypothetical protein